MVDKATLEEMSHASIRDIAPDRLQDILEIQVEGETASQRLESFLEQAGNPYCFRVGNTPVQVSFRESGETLGTKIKAYFEGLKH